MFVYCKLHVIGSNVTLYLSCGDGNRRTGLGGLGFIGVGIHRVAMSWL